jgi:hypothetical protein
MLEQNFHNPEMASFRCSGDWRSTVFIWFVRISAIPQQYLYGVKVILPRGPKKRSPPGVIRVNPVFN